MTDEEFLVMLNSPEEIRRILHIDASARAGLSGRDERGSHSRRLSQRFVDRWSVLRPGDIIAYRDVALDPPAPVDAAWIAAAFTPPSRRTPSQVDRLVDSDRMVEELVAADLLVIGAPMYNFGLPSTLKAWIDNIVRVGVTFGFDRNRSGEPYWPMLLGGKRLVILTARGDFGYDPGERLAEMNLVEAGLKVPLRYIGLTDSDTVAIEYDEFSDERLAASITAAELAVDKLVDRLAGSYLPAK